MIGKSTIISQAKPSQAKPSQAKGGIGSFLRSCLEIYVIHMKSCRYA